MISTGPEVYLMSDVLLPSAEMAYSTPDAQGFYGPYGGTFVPETVMPALQELAAGYHEAMEDAAFVEELRYLLRDYVGRPSPLYRADRLAAEVGLGAVYLKREDLNHTGAHKVNNTVGQCLLAKRMGKKRVIAETGPVSTVWPRPRQPRCSVRSAPSSWVSRTSGARRSTSTRCGCWALRWSP